MGSAHSRLTHANIPFDILDAIFLHLDKPSDLLHVGLTAKKYCDLVIPHHIDYRIIRCDCRRPELWRMLAQYPGRASHIKTLEIIEEGPHYKVIDGPLFYPRAPHDDVVSLNEGILNHGVCLPLLARAVSNMSSLVRFSFSDAKWASDEVFAAVERHCKHIEEFEVLIGYANYDNPERRIDFMSTSIWSLSNLTRFAFAANHHVTHGAHVEEYTALMVDMLRRCPNLEDLQILQRLKALIEPGNVGAALRNLFIDVQWPKLKRATIEGFYLQDDQANDFFARHPLLESLCIRANLPDVIRFRRESLPSLRFLHLDYLPEVADIEDVAGCLEGLVVSFPDDSEVAEDSFEALTQMLTSIRFLVILDGHYDDDSAMLDGIANLAPTLEGLAIIQNEDDEANNIPLSDLCDFISELPMLSHLSLVAPYANSAGLKGFSGSGTSVEADAALLAADAPRLRSVEVQAVESNIENTRCIFVRQGGNIQNPEFDAGYQFWGNFYRGAAQDYLVTDGWETQYFNEDDGDETDWQIEGDSVRSL